MNFSGYNKLHNEFIGYLFQILKPINMIGIMFWSSFLFARWKTLGKVHS